MSRIMHELKQSELRGYQSHHVPNSAMAISKKKGSSVAMGLLFMLVPSLIVGGTLAYQSYNDQQQSPSAKQPVDVVQLEQAPQPDVEVEIAEAGTQSVDTASEGVKNKALFAVVVLLYPLVDLLRVFIIRIKKGNSPFQPDKNHIHHVLHKKGVKPIYNLILIEVISTFSILFLLIFT